MRWTEQPIFFIDFEGSQASGILEYGVATLREGRIVDTRTRLCRATGPVRAEDAAVHGLHEADTAAAGAVGRRLGLFRRPARARTAGGALCVGGELAAEVGVAVSAQLARFRPAGRADHGLGAVGRHRPAVCAAGAAAGRPASSKTLVAACGLQAALDALAASCCPAGRRRYHAALYDALAGALLLARLAAEPAVADKSMAWLLEMSTLNPEKRDALSQGRLF